MTATVVTSENAQEFYAARLATPEPPAVATETVELVEESGAEGTGTGAEATQVTDEAQGKQKVHLRFSELTEQRKAAEARAEKAEAEAKSERAARVLAEQQRQELEVKLNPPKEEIGEEPLPEQFTDAKEYAKAYADYTVEKREKEEGERQTLAARQKVIDTFTVRRKDFAATTPDFEATIASATGVVHNAVRDAILESEFAPQLMYHLAKNPEVVEELKNLPLASQVRRIGRLESQFEAKAPPKDPPVVAQEVSRAPPPINPLKGASSPVESAVDAKGEFHGTFAAYKAARKAGKI